MKSGISDIIFTLMNNVQFRPDCNVIISRCEAEKFLSESKSEIESITAKYYEIIATSSRYTGYTSDITIADVFDRLTDTFGEASAILGSITEYSSNSGAAAVDTDTIAGETTAVTGNNSSASANIDVVGLAVFKNDILVGELSSIETLCHLIITSDMEECIITIPSPFDANVPIDLYLNLGEKTKNSVKLVNGSPYITCDVKLTARILSVDENSDYFKAENLKMIEEYANSYLKSQMENYLYKTSKDFGSDIDLFGRYAVKYFWTWDEWEKYNWLDNYKNSFFKVNCDVNIKSSYLVS